MIRNTLFAALAVTLYAVPALAQDYDSRFYVAPYVGAVINDSKRDAENAGLLGLSFGRFISPNISVEADVNRFDADLERAPGSWQVTGLGLNGRVFFGGAEGWRPYGLLGLGTARSQRDGSKSTSGFDAKLGFGVQNAFTDRVSARFEGVYRFTQDDESIMRENDYSDFVANFGLVVALGEGGGAPMVSEEAKDLGTPKAEMMDEPKAEMPAPEPAVEEMPVAMADDNDKDGVANDKDKCPTTPMGDMVSKSTGCPIEEVIDLRGVNFDFDKCTLRPDAITILNNAVDVLKGNAIVVSVEGHTDSRGSDSYNQKLSECRANVVKTYLMNNGVDNGKISGSAGWGEGKPIATNDTDDGRAQNRRTELVRQQN
jgi:OmpA-OmpF porin, OOP family